MKTIFFESKFGVNIKDFHTTEEIDKFIEDKLGIKLQVKKIDTNIL